jgi:xanthine/uracil permease
MMFGGTISVPFILTPALCIEENDPVRSAIVSTIIFVSGIITLLHYCNPTFKLKEQYRIGLVF